MPTLPRTARRGRAVPVVLATFLVALLTAVPVAAAEDMPPTVASTTPADGATGVAVGATLSVTFSEPVDLSGDWFSVECATSSNHLAAASGGPLTWSINPVKDFAAGEACSLTIAAANVADQDGDDPPDTMAADVVVGFMTAGATPPPPPPADDPGAPFGTFKKPFKPLPEINKVKAGSWLRIGFILDGELGRQRIRATSEAYPCGTTPPTTATKAATLRGHKAFWRGRHADTYAFMWKTKKSWKDSCRVFVVQLADGRSQAIAFRFK